jgi:hypothetical protein
LCVEYFENIKKENPNNSIIIRRYNILLKVMNNSSLKANNLLKKIESVIPSIHLNVKKNPQLTFIVFILKTVCGISLVENFDYLYELNIHYKSRVPFFFLY